MQSASKHSLLEPQLIEGDLRSLGINSVLSDLPLHTFSVAPDCSIQALMTCFVQAPDLPGVVITEVERVSTLSRQQFLDCMLQLGHTSFFQEGSLRLILSQANRKALKLSGDTSILLGAQQALKRPIEQQSDPLLIQQADGYRLLDAHTLNVAHWQIRGIETQIRYERLHMQLLQSEKMAALGSLVDGVAHEILDPVSFIWGNLGYIADYAKQQHELLLAYEAELPQPPPRIVQLREDIEIDYLRSDLPAAISSARSGAHRLKQLASSLQNFCHIDEIHPRPTDIHTLIDSTLRLLRSRLSTPIEVERCYGKLPPVPCFPGQLGQVFMDIFVRSIDSLLTQAHREHYTDSFTVDKTHQIVVTTCVLADQDSPKARPDESRWVSIIISDNGPGLLPETKAQIIESFSTERRSRRETGLAMSYQIVTAKHGGRFWVRSCHESESNHESESKVCETKRFSRKASPSPTGTEFEILLPLTVAQ